MITPKPPFPQKIQRKTEAVQLALDLFPDFKQKMSVLEIQKVPFPHVHIEMQAKDILVFVFEWLLEKTTRVYKRPRCHLFHQLAERLIKLVHDTNTDWHRQFEQEYYWKYGHRSYLPPLSGDGDGI